MTPKISIITPVRVEHEQGLKWLVECVESVKAQTFDDWEMVIVNDHSDVSWRDIEHIFGDPRLRGMRARKTGVSEARNQAASEAQAELLLPLDGDDRLPKGAIEGFLNAWSNGGNERGIVYSDVYMFGDDHSRYFRAPDYDFGTLLVNTFMIVGCLHRKSDWEKVGGWDVRFDGGLEDWEYWIKMGEHGVCGHHAPHVLYEYRRHVLGRLASVRSDPDRWQAALQTLRSVHQETYSGKWPKMCCGGFRKSHPPVKTVRISLDEEPLANPVMMRYTGSRQGSFGMRGKPSGRHYRVLGPEIPFPVEETDVAYLRQFNFGRDFARAD